MTDHTDLADLEGEFSDLDAEVAQAEAAEKTARRAKGSGSSKSKTPRTAKAEGDGDAPSGPVREKMVRLAAINDGDLLSGEGLEVVITTVRDTPYRYNSPTELLPWLTRRDYNGEKLGEQVRALWTLLRGDEANRGGLRDVRNAQKYAASVRPFFERLGETGGTKVPRAVIDGAEISERLTNPIYAPVTDAISNLVDLARQVGEIEAPTNEDGTPNEAAVRDQLVAIREAAMEHLQVVENFRVIGNEHFSPDENAPVLGAPAEAAE